MEENFSTLKRLILDKTEGTPFFMEEVVQTLAEEGALIGERGHYRITHHAPTLHLPPTVQGVLAARIDRLAAEEKDFLHQLAIIGREFSLGLVKHVVTQPEEELYRLLSSLQSKEFLYEQPAFPEPDYIFKHVLTQEVAYGTVLQDKRKVLHERTAQAIESLFHDKLEDHYSELAHHYTRSGSTQKAIEYLQLAGQQAVQRSANVEAINHLTTALELLKALPNTPERAQRELTLLIALGPAFYATKGPAALEMAEVYTRAQDLCQQVGDTPQLFFVLRGLYAFHLVRGAFRTAHVLGEQLLKLAQSVQHSTFLPEAHFAFGQTLLHFQGELAAARHQYEQGIACYDPKQHHAQAFLYGQDSGVFCRAQVAWDLWLLGYPEQARQRSQEALMLARELAHPQSLAFALLFAAYLQVFLREEQATHELTETLIRLCADQGFLHLLSYGTPAQGWVLAAQGEGEKGIAQIRQGLAALRALGLEINRPTLLAWLAEGYQKEGHTEEGLGTLDEALEVICQNEERWYEAELYRLKGELSLQSRSPQSSVSDPRPLAPDPQAEAEAEGYFLKAIEIARKQQAKSLELRATMSLARLWQQQGKHHEARNMLSEVYTWFTEGFDTKDLQEAKALLEELQNR
jgi:predicted ATPase